MYKNNFNPPCHTCAFSFVEVLFVSPKNKKLFFVKLMLGFSRI
jgi:hypothetical protein